MRRRWLTRAGIAALAAAAALGAAACGGDDDESADTSGGGGAEDIAAVIDAARRPGDVRRCGQGRHVPHRQHRLRQQRRLRPLGRVLRLRLDDLQHDDAPHAGDATPFTAGEAGNELVPDLATEIPEVSADGLTYTFTIKDGVTFGPPVNREVTSQDILYSFERIGTPSVAAQYAFYYNVIEGMEDFAAGKAKTISGITTPDDKTHHLQADQPTGDFLYRVAMPATAPIPEEVAKCHTAGRRVRALRRHHRART